MNKKAKDTTFPINIGSSSILLVFVVLCLVAFATLSIVSANADAKLSAKIAERSQAYYQAQNQAVLCLGALDHSLAEAYEASTSTEEYFTMVGQEKTYHFPLSDMQSLSIKVNIIYPENPGDTFYEITSWQVITTSNVEYENSMIIID